LAGSARGALAAVNDRVPGALAIALANTRPMGAGRMLVLEFDVAVPVPTSAHIGIVQASLDDQ
jgi:hypothetical protein